ncbi:hypothetical protein B0O99DRAFT_694813 [Bisporella sp. PMI_857]|nr:hypothetical protein B0O99DRAFT_694813 [Bisporella sp. PMI_857]
MEDMGLTETGLSNNGTIVRVVDFPPKSIRLVHWSMTLDCVYVLKGGILLTLDGGSRTKVCESDSVIQQPTQCTVGTMRQMPGLVLWLSSLRLKTNGERKGVG